MPSLMNTTVPIREDAHGVLRVGETRVLLELVLNDFDNGATPEQIVDDFPALRLADVYAVIAYYLDHRDEIAVSRAARDRTAAEIREKLERRQPDRATLRERLLRRRQNGVTREVPAAE